MTQFDPAVLRAKAPGDLTAAERDWVVGELQRGGTFLERPLDVELDRRRALDVPSHFVVSIDDFYKRNLDERHFEMLDRVAGPYLLGETVSFDGHEYTPQDHLGLLILLPRGLYKSSLLGLVALWIQVKRKIDQGLDARVMYTHQVIKKAVQRGEVIRRQAKFNEWFRSRFSEFRAPEGEWDTKEQWSWPNYTSHGAAEASFTAYGESSDKTGGHYTDRFVDDYETEKSVTTADMIEKSWGSFEMMDNLEDLSKEFNPYVICGTTYHWQGVNSRVARDGGYIVYKVPAHQGSSKKLFDLAALDPRDVAQAAQIEAGLVELETERGDDLNFKNSYTWRKLYRKARAGRSAFGGQQQLDPTPEGDRRFDHVAIDESWVSEVPGPDSGIWLYVRVDPAISEKKVNDETCIKVGGCGLAGFSLGFGRLGGAREAAFGDHS